MRRERERANTVEHGYYVQTCARVDALHRRRLSRRWFEQIELPPQTLQTQADTDVRVAHVLISVHHLFACARGVNWLRLQGHQYSSGSDCIVKGN